MSTPGGKKRVFSGIQPSGDMHLGNYLGAIKNWVDGQHDNDNIFCIVDLHAITVPQDPKELHRRSRELAMIYIAAGLDPKTTAIFIQSHVKEHTELAWLFNCVTPLGWANRMTQFKEKSADTKEKSSVGLLAYPMLMAADILLYQTDGVPVGEDQRQHLELTRDIAQTFNHHYGEVFKIPEAWIRKEGARIMSLQDPTKKMSKSDPQGCVFLLDPVDTMRQRIMRAVTDSGREVRFDEARPGLYNLLTLHQLFSGQPRDAIEAHFEGKGYGDLKKEVVELVTEGLRPLQTEFQRLAADPSYIEGVLEDSAERIRPMAQATMRAASEAMGLG
ncbi:MAG TPA: tryptophan--tRNA ligase [Chloroflexota bacterium]|nr:tryptophan--tRNA ligase [Chloroflexota bacterium]